MPQFNRNHDEEMKGEYEETSEDVLIRIKKKKKSKQERKTSKYRQGQNDSICRTQYISILF